MAARSGESMEMKLRRELIHAKSQIADLQEELEEKQNLYLNAMKDRDRYKEQLNSAKDSIRRVDSIMQSKVDLAIEQHKQKFAQMNDEKEMYKQQNLILTEDKRKTEEKNKDLLEKWNSSRQQLEFFRKDNSTSQMMDNLEKVRAEKEAKDKECLEQLRQINDLSNKIEDFMAENRVLKQMANVPDNFGMKVKIEEIKLHDKEKIEDYKRLIKVLQDDNFMLEQERAKLKQRIKHQSMLYKTANQSGYYNDLNEQQQHKVDQYVIMVKNGTDEEEDIFKLRGQIKRLKEQLEEGKQEAIENLKQHIENMMGSTEMGGTGLSDKALKALKEDNDTIKEMIQKILSKGVHAINTGAPGATQSFSNTDMSKYGRFRPPVPREGADGDVPYGMSFKFESPLNVIDEHGKIGNVKADLYNNAVLQLLLQESFQIVREKDDAIMSQQKEIAALYQRVRSYLLTQDQLYKDYVNMERSYQKKEDEFKQQINNVRDQLREEESKVSKLENVIQTLKDQDELSVKNRFIEVTKQNSILDINLLRLARKYQILEEQEKLLRRNYHAKDEHDAQKDTFVVERINKLKSWKASAILQLRLIFTKLRNAVPLSEYQSLTRELDLYKQKNADFIDRNSKLQQKILVLQRKDRENQEVDERIRVMQEDKEDLHNEYTIIKNRLINLDPSYKWECMIFDKVVQTLKRAKISPEQAFEEFDENKDGRLAREEFVRALEIMKINDLSHREIEILMNSCDTDNDGFINYKEFVKKLKRHGVRVRSNEEQIIYQMLQAIQRSKLNGISDLFQIIDKNNRGIISREDFSDIFESLKLKIRQQDIEKFLDHFWKDNQGGIDYKSFLRIFNKYQSRIDQERYQQNQKYVRVSEETIRTKKKVYSEIDLALRKQNATLKTLFQAVDRDKSFEIELDEFKEMFEKMSLRIQDKQVKEMFASIDFDYSNSITFQEFQADFNEFVRKDIEVLLNDEREREIQENKKTMQPSSAMYDQFESIQGLNENNQQNMEIKYKTKISILEAKEKQAYQKLERSKNMIANYEREKRELQMSHAEQEKRWLNLTEEHYKQTERVKILENEKRDCIKKTDAQQIKLENEDLLTKLTETRAAMLSYKSMTEVLAEQVRNMKIMHERNKDENENLIKALRELQSQTIDQQRVGKLYYIIMLSRWQEAAVNKKYAMVLGEVKELRRECMNEQEYIRVKENEHFQVENILQNKTQELEVLNKQFKQNQNLFMSANQEEDLNKQINEIMEEKTELEELYIKLKTENYSMHTQVDSLQASVERHETIARDLKSKNKNELSDSYLQMSEKLQSLKLNELRACRERDEMRDKYEYQSKLLKGKNERVISLEEKVSQLEGSIHKKEEEFRRNYNDKVQQFFQKTKFDEQIDESLITTSKNETGTFKNPLNTSGPINFGRHQKNKSSIDSQPFSIMSRQGKQDQQDVQEYIIKIKEQEKEIVKLTNEKNLLTTQLMQFKKWKETDTYMTEGDEKLRGMMDIEMNKFQQVQTQEEKEMANAAYQTIQTLQEMIDSKNAILKSKEEQIDKMRLQMNRQREEDAETIRELQKKFSVTEETTFNKLQQIVTRHDMNNTQNESHNAISQRAMTLTKEQLQQNLDSKDHRIKQLEIVIQGLKEEKKQIYDRRLEMIKEIDDLKQELQIEKEKQEVKTLKKTVARLERQLKEKSVLNENLKKFTDELNMRMQSYEKAKLDLEDKNLVNKQREQLDTKKFNDQIQAERNKNNLILAKRTEVEKELTKMKSEENERKDKLQKIMKEKEQLRENLEKERGSKSNDHKKYLAAQDQVRKLQEKIRLLEDQSKMNEQLKSVSTGKQMTNQQRGLEQDVIIQQMIPTCFSIILNKHVPLEFKSTKQDLKLQEMSQASKFGISEFRRVIKTLDISLSDAETNKCFKVGQSLDNSQNFDIKRFILKCNQLFQDLNMGSGSGGAGAGASMESKIPSTQAYQNQSKFENWETEKKYKKKLEGLKQEIEEKNREILACKKEVESCQQRSLKIEKEKQALEARLVDKNSKPPGQTKLDQISYQQMNEIQDLKDKLNKKEEENHRLNKTISVIFKAEMSKLTQEKDIAEEKLRKERELNIQYQEQINKLIGKPMDKLEEREEGELWKQNRIDQLEEEINSRNVREQDLQDQLFDAEKGLLELKFEKETYDLQYARLQKRIADLEQYKNASSYQSAINKNKSEADHENIHDMAHLSQDPRKAQQKGETVRLRNKSSKSVAELEMLVEQLKRLVEKLRTENDALKKSNTEHESKKDKIANEKQLRLKINQLEQVIQSYEMKDENEHEKEKTIKKLIEANKHLRDDLKREAERYSIIEDKYKELLYKFNQLGKENAKNKKMVFQMTTGANIDSYNPFMENESDIPSGGREKKQYF